VTKILLKCRDVVGAKMAGPAIRYWEFAQALSRKYTVTLQVPSPCTVKSDRFQIVGSHEKLNYKNYDVLISQLIDPWTAYEAKKEGVRMIYDAYDPEPLEHMEIFKSEKLSTRNFFNKKIVQTVNFSLEMADGYLCANPKQRDLWIGALLSLYKITPQVYDADSALKKNLVIVPFGMPSKTPHQTKEGFRKKYAFRETDKLLIWGGGIWNWFDPLTLISAMKIISHKRQDIKLVFMGLIHPNANSVPEMSMAHQAKSLAISLDLIDKTVFFNDTWIPYEDRENYLLEADLGISTHFDHLETHYSFRTRLLDYLWCELPIIATGGDVFGDLIEKHQIGSTVQARQSTALAQKIEFFIDQPELIKKMKLNIQQLKPQYYWENLIQPLEEMIDFFKNIGRSQIRMQDLTRISFCMWNKVKPYALYQKWISTRKS